MAVANQGKGASSSKRSSKPASATGEKVVIRVPKAGAFDVVRDDETGTELHRGKSTKVDAAIAKRLLARPGEVVEQVNPSR